MTTSLKVAFDRVTSLEVTRRWGTIEWELDCPMIDPVGGVLPVDADDDWTALLVACTHVMTHLETSLALADAGSLDVVARWYRLHAVEQAATPVDG